MGDDHEKIWIAPFRAKRGAPVQKRTLSAAKCCKTRPLPRTIKNRPFGGKTIRAKGPHEKQPDSRREAPREWFVHGDFATAQDLENMFCKISLPPRNSFYCFAFLQKKLEIPEEDKTQTIENTQKEVRETSQKYPLCYDPIGVSEETSASQGPGSSRRAANQLPRSAFAFARSHMENLRIQIQPPPPTSHDEQLQRHVGIAKGPCQGQPLFPKRFLKSSLVPGGKSCLSERRGWETQTKS